MATKLTTKKPLSVNKRSHAMNATKSQQKPNLQTRIVDGVKVKLSAREFKTLNKKNTTVKEEE